MESPLMAFSYGVIEGLYDKENIWNWSSRKAYVNFCAARSMDFFIYAPKNDPFLREQWQQPWPQESFDELKALASGFQSKGIRFGIGFTPYNIRELDKQSRLQLKEKVNALNELNPDILCILFDDFTNDVIDLARKQAEIADYIASLSTAKQFIVCGTYYSKDPLLQRVYGAMPENYWSEQGKYLDPKFDIFWTGDHVISLGYDQPGLQQIADDFRRKPFLWDNYPVNDPDWLKSRLRIYTFTGRPWQISEWCSGHAANTMIQPWLSMIPIATLSDLYQQKERFDGHASFRNTVHDLCGDSLAKAIIDNLIYLTEEGTLNFSEFTRQRLQDTFSALQSPVEKPFSDEIVHWLNLKQ
ncbi:beta-N-acetylglucosaminidase domain-containing protein [Endozoicomonas ascidiicola]|uniref:beta-N-acetylglucosaminidase domain-containing protein n=1 Tax=Endozoicomonas ascidiicola TaxID=1698521 RepID=UPI0012F72C43|nr:beta-N-acetylglucosaminidase domain-containing protein [Endozoicomonas ascidiicola]